MKKYRHNLLTILIVLLAHTVGAQQPAEKKEGFKNLQVLDKNMPEDKLIDLMKTYTGSLGVRCEFCHLQSADRKETYFDSDSLEHKRIAREMIKMVADINGKYLPIATHSGAEVTDLVNCMTCHRGSKSPVFIEDILMRAHKAGGSDSAIAAYRNLREVWYGRAKYDFGAQPLTGFTATLFDTDTIGAMAMQAMNIDLNPKSIDAMVIFAQMLIEVRDSATALYYLDSCLVMNPQHRGATTLKKALNDNGLTKGTAPVKK